MTPCRDIAYPRQGLQGALADPLLDLAGREIPNYLGRAPESAHPVGGAAARSSWNAICRSA
ncbi:MAG TPA: hypothetical protein VG253_03935 [Streptosporangiaceae bacterium]|nr:hypothetical protein [Streptosporangiaceae bacterium]